MAVSRRTGSGGCSGNTYRATELLDFLIGDCDCLTDPTDRQQAFAAELAEFTGYIKTNAGFICDYGERHRCGEAISSSIAESAVVNRWYPRFTQLPTPVP